MASQFFRGVFSTATPATWHNEEERAEIETVDDLVRAGQDVGALPLGLHKSPLEADGIPVLGYYSPVGYFARHEPIAMGAVQSRYCCTDLTRYEQLLHAIGEAGGRPDGLFSLMGGSRVVATFEVGQSNGFTSHINLADSYDGSLRLTLGVSTIRVVCQNTFKAFMATDGEAATQLRHTSSMPAQMDVLRSVVAEAIQTGDTVRDLYHRAADLTLTGAQMDKALEVLFPYPGGDNSKRTRAHARADNMRDEARIASAMPVNNEGDSLATLWNAATLLVDRTASGEARPLRGDAGAMDSMLFGARAERVNQIETLIEVLMADGSTVSASVTDAIGMGADPKQIGASLLEAMLD